ncbi:MAG: hypothetical protein MRY74_03295, partial [Neomegalonema sp.]|nr:hypothetical protein [Neomegalonema sp.]
MTGVFEWMGRNISRILMAVAFFVSLVIGGGVMAERFGWLPNYLCRIGFAEAAGLACVESRIDAMRRAMA